MANNCGGTRWGDGVQVCCTEQLEKLNTYFDFYEESSPYYGTKARARFLVQHGSTAEAAREQAARERKAKPVKAAKTAKKPLPLAIINGEKVYGK